MASLLSNRSLVYISGKDSASFLQNLLTNDINSPKPFYAYILSAQGKFLFDVFVIKYRDGFLLDIFEPTKEEFLDKLDMYSINQDVDIEDFDQNAKLYYAKDPVDKAEITYKDSRNVSLGYRFVSFDDLDDDNSYIQDKYEYSIPDGGIDMIYEKSLAPEYGAEELSAVSFTKGCYVGQEVMSRTKYQGEIRKHLYKIKAQELDISPIEHGAEITQNGKKIGIFCSGYKQLGIALIRSQNIDESGDILLEGDPVTIEKASWYS